MMAGKPSLMAGWHSTLMTAGFAEIDEPPVRSPEQPETAMHTVDRPTPDEQIGL
jgi:hypothetical protein